MGRLSLRHTYMPKTSVDFAGPSYFGGKHDQLVLCAGKGMIHLLPHPFAFLFVREPKNKRTDAYLDSWRHPYLGQRVRSFAPPYSRSSSRRGPHLSGVEPRRRWVHVLDRQPRWRREDMDDTAERRLLASFGRTWFDWDQNDDNAFKYPADRVAFAI